jgi:DNA-binding MarR family transcriptional regulator
VESWHIPAEHVTRLLRFNRFYEERIVALHDAMQINEMIWTEWRVLRALGESPCGSTSAWLRDKLRIDGGNLSRMIKTFALLGFVTLQGTSVRGSRKPDSR